MIIVNSFILTILTMSLMVAECLSVEKGPATLEWYYSVNSENWGLNYLACSQPSQSPINLHKSKGVPIIWSKEE